MCSGCFSSFSFPFGEWCLSLPTGYLGQSPGHVFGANLLTLPFHICPGHFSLSGNLTISSPLLKMKWPFITISIIVQVLWHSPQPTAPLLTYFWPVCLITCDNPMICSFLNGSCHHSAVEVFANVIPSYLCALPLYTRFSSGLLNMALIQLLWYLLICECPLPSHPTRPSVLRLCLICVSPVQIKPSTWDMKDVQIMLINKWMKKGIRKSISFLLIDGTLMVHRLNPGHLSFQC